MNLIPNAGKIAASSLAVWGGFASQAIPFILQAASTQLASVPNISDGTRSMLQLGFAVVLVPLGRVIQQDLAKRFPTDSQ